LAAQQDRKRYEEEKLKQNASLKLQLEEKHDKEGTKHMKNDDEDDDVDDNITLFGFIS
jgi:hypothetical protein